MYVMKLHGFLPDVRGMLAMRMSGRIMKGFEYRALARTGLEAMSIGGEGRG